MRMTAAVVVSFVMLSCSIGLGQSLAQVADQEKQRRGESTRADDAMDEGVIDEYTLAGYKALKTTSTPTTDTDASEQARSGRSEVIESEKKPQPREQPKTSSSLAKRMVTACAKDPDGVVCASLRQRVERAKKSP